MSLSSKSHWDKGYLPSVLPRRTIISPGWNYADYEMLTYIKPYLPSNTPSRRIKLVEMGCGGSRWLPYFASNLQYTVAGIDYSEKGCDLAVTYLRSHGHQGDIYCRDFQSMGDEFNHSYDIVFSLGVVEHFETTSDIVGQFATCLAPQGIIITIVPNMAGGMGLLQYKLDESVYNIHVPLNLDKLIQAHTAHGLHILASSYLGFATLQMVNIRNIPLPPVFVTCLDYTLPGLDLLHLYWRRITRHTVQSAFWSSYAIVIAQSVP